MDDFIEYVKKCGISPIRLSKELGCSVIYIRLILAKKTPYNPSARFVKKCQDWMKTCWACGQDVKNG